MASSKEELFLLIRRDSWQQGLSVRALARKYRVHRRLVREALCSTVSPRPRPSNCAAEDPRHKIISFPGKLGAWCLPAIKN
ncbi:hypothetical protein [Streptomyces mirabilis]|uniref:hypothetical protein n=1 Tax=Streptomyces mirabilis TaxID=68239 RepID=UPI0033AA3761